MNSNDPAPRSAPRVGLVLLLVSAGLLAGCSSSPHIATDTAPGADFAALKYFALMAASAAENTSLGPSHIRQIEASIEADLKVRGYVPAPPSNADFLVAYHTRVDDKLDDARLGYSTRQWQTVHTRSPGVVGGLLGGPRGTTETTTWETGFDHDLQHYQESTLILDIVNAKTRELVWRGWARRSADREQPTPEELKQAVTLLLKKFPPRL